jgi:hypothetical protein
MFTNKKHLKRLRASFRGVPEGYDASFARPSKEELLNSAQLEAKLADF